MSLVLLVRDSLFRHKKLKVLEVGSMILFGALATYCIVTKHTWTVAEVRVRVDVGLLMIVILSIAVRRPFTLQYAREQTPEVWGRAEFVRTNYIITWVWAGAFAVMVAADLAMAYVPTLPNSIGIAATIVAIAGAIKFTSWCPEHLQTSADAKGPQ